MELLDKYKISCKITNQKRQFYTDFFQSILKDEINAISHEPRLYNMICDLDFIKCDEVDSNNVLSFRSLTGIYMPLFWHIKYAPARVAVSTGRILSCGLVLFLLSSPCSIYSFIALYKKNLGCYDSSTNNMNMLGYFLYHNHYGALPIRYIEILNKYAVELQYQSQISFAEKLFTAIDKIDWLSRSQRNKVVNVLQNKIIIGGL